MGHEARPGAAPSPPRARARPPGAGLGGVSCHPGGFSMLEAEEGDVATARDVSRGGPGKAGVRRRRERRMYLGDRLTGLAPAGGGAFGDPGMLEQQAEQLA